jgi:hypothetical protein
MIASVNVPLYGQGMPDHRVGSCPRKSLSLMDWPLTLGSAVIVGILTLQAVITPTAVAASETPRVFLLDPDALVRSKSLSIAHPEILDPLLKQAQRTMRVPLMSVTEKSALPPSGDPHDYLSQSVYYWPNPNTPDGMPWVLRDGERNPAINEIPDHQYLGRPISALDVLSLAYYYTGDEAYAARATQHLRSWFLDPTTRMNPNLQYTQFVPGKNEGAYSGIIDTQGLNALGDDIGLLAGSVSWTADDQDGMRLWCDEYLNWLQTSPNGKREGRTTNNHATYYDTQIVSLSLFLDRPAVAAEVAQNARANRIATQIEPDGKQPLELRRTPGWHYSLYNLEAFFNLAALNERAGVDLWSYQTADGRGIKSALDYLVPYAMTPETFPYQQITGWSNDDLVPLLYLASTRYGDAHYFEVAQALGGSAWQIDRARLIYSLAPE